MKTPGHYLLKIVGTSTFTTKATQVPVKPGSLDSNYCFVLRKSSHFYVWCGSYTSGDNREMAKAFAGTEFALITEGKNIQLLPNNIFYKIISLGNETPDFWHNIGGKGPYFIDKRVKDDCDVLPAKLYQISTRQFTYRLGTLDEILNYEQEDLTPEDIMILDAFSVLFIWVGSTSARDDINPSINFAIDYLNSDPAGRDERTPIHVVRQGCEPPTFIGCFDEWKKDFWKVCIFGFIIRE